MDFKNLNCVWELKRFCVTCIELNFKFCLSEFYFQLEFSFNFDFQMHKTHLKSFVSKFCLFEIISVISLMTRLEVYAVFSL